MNAGRRFKLMRELGSGAFGTVYLAEMESQGGFRKEVAVKLLNAELSNFTDASKRLRDEARLLGRLQHRNIVRVDDLLRLDGRWAIVMEHIKGYDLEVLLQANEALDARLSAPACVEIAYGVASALDAAWSSPGESGEPLQVVHRDIKPSNVRLSPNGDVKVLDFGIARADFAEREAKTGAIRYGSLGYLSPERLLGDPDVSAGDVFAVGCVLYELIAREALGRIELRPESHAEQIKAAHERVVSELSEQEDQEAVQALADLIARTLAYQADDRPTAGEMAKELKELRRRLSGERLHDFCERVLPRIPEVFDDKTRPARGTLTEEGLSTSGTPIAEAAAVTSNSNPTLVFDAFDDVGGAPAADSEGGTGPEAGASSGPMESDQAPGSEPNRVPWIVAGILLLVGVSAAYVYSGQEPEPVGIEAPTEPTEQVPVEDPAETQEAGGEQPVLVDAQQGDPVEAGQEGSEVDPAASEATQPLETPKPPVERTPPVERAAPVERTAPVEVVEAPAEVEAVTEEVERLRSAKFSVDGASAVSVRCGDVKGKGSSSALLRDLPAGRCSVSATVDGAELSGSIEVTKPMGVTCTPDGSALSCR